MNCRKIFSQRFFIILILGGILLTGAAGFADDNLPSYKIQVRVDTDAKKLTAVQTVTFTNSTDKNLAEAYFHIYANRLYTPSEAMFIRQYASYFRVNPFPEGLATSRMIIAEVKNNNDTTSFAIEGLDKTLLRVALTKELMPGQSTEITINYEVMIPHSYGRLGWHKNIMAVSHWYPILSVLDKEGWHNDPFYPFHRPFFSDAAHYLVELSVPTNQVVIHSGQSVFVTHRNDGTKTLKIQTPLPVREFTFALSPDYKLMEKNFNGIKLKSFYLAGNEFYAKQTLDDVQDLMAFYGKLFGPYPYEEYSVAPVYLGYGGEQMSNMSFIDTRVYELPKALNRYFDFLVAHETGHQWFYNLVGTNEFQHMWMEEGVNSYFLLEYLEDKYGKNAEVLPLPKELNWLLPNFSFRTARDTRYKIVARTHLDHPIDDKLSSFNEPSSIFSIAYGKGSGVLSMLHSVMGDEAFDRAWRRIFEEYRYKNLLEKDFIRICEEESKQDLKWFFNEWLNTKEHCDYAVDKVKDGQITLANRGGIIMLVKIKVDYRDGTSEVLNWDGRDKEKKLTVPLGKTIQKVTLDPDQELLDIDRTNNSWPRTVRIKPVPLYFGLYDIPVFLPDDSYNFIVGPEISQGLGVKASFQKPYDQNLYAGTDYDFGEKLHHSRVGYQVNNLFHSQTAAGFELFNTHDLDDGEDDLAGGKLYLRKELWPAAYGLGDINDHITFYLVRDRSFSGDFLNGLEDTRNTSYLKKNESIVGTNLHFGRSGTYPDPSQGYEINTSLENSGHFLGATQYFYRSATDISLYHQVTAQSKMALRLKYAWGYPDDKNLFELGGIDGLRGFGRKTIRGSNGALSSVEYRFPIVSDINASVADRALILEDVGGVVFFDCGQAWYQDIGDSNLKKDAGLGLRFTVNVGAFLEKVMVRLDVAQAIHQPKEETHFWFGLNHAF